MNQSQLQQRTDVVYQGNLNLLQMTPLCPVSRGTFIGACVCVPIDLGTAKSEQYCTQFS